MWIAQPGSYFNKNGATGNHGCLVGFAEGVQPTQDANLLCYNYDTYSLSGNLIDFWVVIQKNRQYYDIGWATASIPGSGQEHFSMDGSPNRYHVGTKGSRLLATQFSPDSGATYTWTYILAPSSTQWRNDGFLYATQLEDGTYDGAGAWMLDEGQTLPTLNEIDFTKPRDWNAAKLGFTFHPIGSYQSDPALSGTTATLSLNFNFSYRALSSSYNDSISSYFGRYPAGLYYQCWTPPEGTPTTRIGYNIYACDNPLSAEPEQVDRYYVWQGALKDDKRQPRFFVGQSLFKAWKEPAAPGTVYSLNYFGSNRWRHLWSEEDYIEASGFSQGNSINLALVLSGETQWSYTLPYESMGLPTTYRLDFLKRDIDNPDKKFLAGDECVVMI